jgi:hypothetical protein
MIGGKNSTNRNEVLVLSSNTKMLRCCISQKSSKQTNKIALKRKRNAESQLLLLGKEILLFNIDFYCFRND